MNSAECALEYDDRNAVRRKVQRAKKPDGAAAGNNHFSFITHMRSECSVGVVRHLK